MSSDSLETTVAARNETEFRVTALWVDVLGVRPRSIDDELDRGGRKAAEALLAAVRDRWDIHVNVDEFLAAPSIIRLSAIIERELIEIRTRENTMIASALDALEQWTE